MKSIRIFISSPGDVANERQIAGKVIERIQGRYWSLIRIEDVFWENEAMRATATFQDEIDDPADCEIVIGIIWTKMGSPLPERFKKIDGSSHANGTEWEIERAITAYEDKIKAGADPKSTFPNVVVYRRREKRSPLEDPQEEEKAKRNEEYVDEYFDREFHNQDKFHTFRRASISYRSTEEFEKKLLRHLAKLVLKQIPILKTAFNIPPISGSPFKELQAFEFHENDRFFGRTREIREIQTRLITNARNGLPFILIYGGSGYGKSSLMRAGLAPNLTRPGGSLGHIAGWRRASFQPAKGDGTLCTRLARTLLQGPTPQDADFIREYDHYPSIGLPELGEESSEGLPWDVASIAAHFSDPAMRHGVAAAIAKQLEKLNRHLFFEIDQLEEVFTSRDIAPSEDQVSKGEEDNRKQQLSAFLMTLGALAQTGRVWIVATMRSEFFPRVAENPELFALVGKNRGYVLPPPSRQSLWEIIRYPAFAARLDFEQRIQDYKIAGESAKHDHLHDQILADAESSPDALPLLEFTLQQLYEERRGDFLTWDSYAGAGGLKGAIAKRATEIYQTLPAYAREASHRVFAALVHVDPARGAVTRQRAPLTSLKSHPGTETFLKSFLDAHLLVTDEDGNTNEPVVTLAHEALITHWEELATWIKDHQGDLLARQRLAEQCRLWIENDRKKPYLLTAARLAEADRVTTLPIFDLDPLENEFFRLSLRASKQRMRFFQAATLVFALLAVGAGGLGWIAEQRREDSEQARLQAQQARTNAEERRVAAEISEANATRAKNTAEGLINSMLFNLRDGLQPLGRLDLLDDVSRQAEAYFTENPPKDAAAERNQAVMWSNRGNVLRDSGDLAAARKAYQQSHEFAERIAISDPHNAQAQSDLSTSLQNLGDVEKDTGNLLAAHKTYQQSLEINESLATADPSNAKNQRDWSVSIGKIGDLAIIENDLGSAREAYQQSLEINGSLASADPSNAQAQRDWGMSLNKLGDVAQAEGDITVARKAYQQFQEIIKRLATANPQNATFQREWSISLANLGLVALDCGDFTAASKFHQQSLAITERLAIADPQNTEAQRDLSVSYTNLGHLAKAEGDLVAARKAYQRSLEISEPLTASDPESAKAQCGWAGTLSDLGFVLQVSGDIAAAREAYQQALVISERLATADPQNAQAQRNWSIALDGLGDLAKAEGDFAAARKVYQQSLDISERLATADPHNAANQRGWFVSLHNLGDLAIAVGDRVSSRKAYEQSLEISERLAVAQPQNVQAQRDWSVSFERLGDIAIAAGDFTTARRAYQESNDICERLAKTAPPNARVQRDWSITLDKLSDVAIGEGDLSAASKFQQQSLTIRERLATADPENVGAQREWVVSLNKLGEASIAKGDLTTAREAYQQSIEVRKRLATADPKNAAAQRDWCVSLHKLGNILTAEGNFVAALKAYQQSLEISERLVAKNPQNAEGQRDLLVSFIKIAELHEAENSPDAKTWWRKAYTQITLIKSRGILAPDDEYLVDLLHEDSQ